MTNLIKSMCYFGIMVYVFNYLKDFNTPYIYLLLINTILILVYFILKKKYIIKNKNIQIIIISLIILFLGYSLVFINDYFTSNIIKNVFVMTIFIVNIYLTSMFIYIKNEKKIFIRITYIFITGFLLICYIINFDNFRVFDSITNIFNSTGRYRETFGIYHPNGVGTLCFASLILSKIIRKTSLSKLKILLLLCDAIIWIMLLSSGSRNAITSVILFYIINYMYRLIERIKLIITSVNLRRFLNMLLISIVIIVVCFLTVKINFIELLTESNRLSNFEVNLPTLFENNKHIFGIGFVDPGIFYQTDIPYKMTYVDNWFLYIFISLGWIGFIVCIFLIGYLIYIILNDKKHRETERILMKSLIITHLYSSFFETNFLFHQFIISYIFWIMYLIYIFEQGNNNLRISNK